MPLIQVDLLKQNDKARLKNILDTIHQCAVEAFEIPERDRYQTQALDLNGQKTRSSSGSQANREPGIKKNCSILCSAGG